MLEEFGSRRPLGGLEDHSALRIEVLGEEEENNEILLQNKNIIFFSLEHIDYWSWKNIAVCRDNHA